MGCYVLDIRWLLGHSDNIQLTIVPEYNVPWVDSRVHMGQKGGDLDDGGCSSYRTRRLLKTQDPTTAVSAFQMAVGQSGTSNKTVKLPKNYKLLVPYSCGPAKLVPASVYPTADHRRKSQALMSWNVTCTYSQFLASKNPSCCVSFSSFYSDTIKGCPACACGCQNKDTCVKQNYTDWTLVVQHPNLNNVTQVYSFEHKPVLPYDSINDTAMFYGLKY
ncbi:hypothetical protein L6164_014482 [Bauhinia variegata]|uniref:Uncharacterized protein n=1 Tax=Bauhinia variegata TaxID=167791 RepID=A0ACB9NIX4_BAUVA|nr:hypothetical protein L6164_014482 [Bauhinia variegata]